MARLGEDNGHTKSGQLRRRGQYRIQHEMMMIYKAFKRLVLLYMYIEITLTADCIQKRSIQSVFFLYSKRLILHVTNLILYFLKKRVERNRMIFSKTQINKVFI